ncbi:MAG: hypothetical protein KDK36_05930, partial [Leptospiraceae bacterium]|nr:hypothetical protein [Leptospiraceae bacterium]
MNDLTINNPNQIQSLEVTRSDTYNTFIKQYNQFLAENDYKINMDSINKYFQECIDFYSIRSLGVIKAAIKEGLEKTFSNSPYYFQLKYAIDKAFTEIKVGKADNKISSENLLTEEEIDQLLIGGNFYDNRVKKEIEIFPDKDLYLLIQFLKETG